ncbi:hypothetical protein ABZP36_024391 [Zizania latifolia]
MALYNLLLYLFMLLALPAISIAQTTGLPECGSEGRKKLSTNLILIIVFSVLARFVFISAVVVWCLILRQQKHRQEFTGWRIRRFRAVDLSECDVLTNLLDENVIGNSGSGKVYRINVGGKGNATKVVAVKRLWRTGKSDVKMDKEFDAEVKILGKVPHKNIVNLLCCISNEDTKLLVYEYMENGSLDRWLHHREHPGAPTSLDWPTRLTIAIDAARGLSYMHHEFAQPIIHRDVKSSNILLDLSFRAKIADFGLARILIKSGEPEAISAIGGTSGYMAPEYGCRSKENEKVDVYNFGVVLLELTTGRAANEGCADCDLAEWAWRRYNMGAALCDVVDAHIQDRAVISQDAVVVFRLGLTCTHDDPASRPSMKEVLKQLIRVRPHVQPGQRVP